MKALSGFFDRLRGQVSEIGEAIAGSQVLRTLDDKIRTTDEQVREWRRMADVHKAQRFSAQERCDAISAKVVQREAQAVAAMHAKRQQLAREVAGAIVELEQARDAERALVGQTDARLAELQHLIERGDNALRRLKHRVDLVRAAETVSRAEASFACSADGVALHIPTALESAVRLRRRSGDHGKPEHAAAFMPASDTLDAKLEAAGLTSPVSPVDAVIAKLSRHLQPPKPSPRRKPVDPSKRVP